MEDILVWLVWVAVIVGSIVSSASKAAKKAREQAAKKTSRPVMRPVVEPRPLSSPMDSVPTSWPVVFETRPVEADEDYYSSEEELDTFDGREYHKDYSAEDIDAEQRYVGGEQGYRGGLVKNRQAGVMTGAPASVSASAGGSAALHADFFTSDSEDIREEDREDDNASTTPLRELLDGDFDLRRAVIEAEILTPKYVQRY
jgi:hypothetical protein